MTQHKVGSREEWLSARKELLELEKDLTRRSDELARQRQELPELFDGRSHPLLDRAPRGRNEGPGEVWMHRHDEYPSGA